MKKALLYIFSALTLGLTSCSDYLDVTPSDKQTAAQLFASKSGYYSAANGIYDAMSSDELYGKNLSWYALELISGSYDTKKLNSEPKSLANGTFTDSYAAPVISDIWGKAYETILAANLLLQQLDEEKGLLTAQEKACLKGEMLAVRAYLHLDMLRLFGPATTGDASKLSIPYNESASVTVLDLLSMEEVGKRIIRDLNAAEELLKNNDPIIENGVMMSEPTGSESVQTRYRQYRLNYYAVIAVKARAYQWLGDNENAVKEAKRLIEDTKVNTYFPAVDPNKLLTEYNAPDRIFSSEVFFGVYKKTRDVLFSNYFASDAPASLRLQATSAKVTGDLFYNLLLGSVESSDYRYMMQWEPATNANAGGNYTFKKYMKIGKPDEDDENSEYGFAKMIPGITMQEMYYIASLCEPDPTGLDGALWYCKARVRRGCMDMSAMASTIGMYTAMYGYGAYFIGNEMKREYFGSGQYFYYLKRQGSVSYPSLPAAEMK